jgi:hypothetical protein
MRSFWYPRGNQILRRGQILHANPRRFAAWTGQKCKTGHWVVP